ncbi:MAG: DUF4268 domain-containing protein [Geobacter sp.]
MNFYQEYWEAFNRKLSSIGSSPLKPKMSSANWLAWSCFKKGGFRLIVSLRQDSDWIAVNFGIYDQKHEHYFTELYDKRHEIEKELGFTLRWVPIGTEKSSTQAILTQYGVDVQNRTDWNSQHSWMLDHLLKMHSVFTRHVRELDS